MKEIDWSKAPEGATHFHPELNGFIAHWVKPGFFCVLGFEREGWKQDFNPGSSLVLVNRPQAWSGEGLPPVGSACEVNDERVGLWEKVDEVLAHSRIAGKDVAVFQIGDYIAYSPADRFRPLRTPDQIAAEERDKAIEEIRRDTDYILDETCASAVLAAGYRKQVQP